MDEEKEIQAVASLERSNFEVSNGSEKGKVQFVDRRGLALGQLFARSGKQESLVNLLGLPVTAGRSLETEEFLALPLSPGQWMLLAEGGANGSFCHSIGERIGGLGYISEQSHSRVVLRISGERSRDILAKGCRLDLHPTVMQPGACITTKMAQVGVLLHQVDNVPSYDLLVYSGFGQFFWQWMKESALEFGYSTAVEQYS